MNTRNVWNKIMKSVVLLGFIFILFYLVQNFDIYNVDRIMDDLHEMAERTSVKIPFIVIATVLLVFFVPISPVAGAAGLLFEIEGILYITVAGLFAALISYAFAKLYRGNVEQWIRKFYLRKEREVPLEEMLLRIREHGFSYALFVRALPFMPFSLGNLIFGVSTVSLMDYLTTTVITVGVGQGINVFLVAMASDFSEQKMGTLFAVALKALYYFMIYAWSKKNRYHAADEKILDSQESPDSL
ncbi:TVP38/TMEM64 family protein [Proteiniclasticum sp. C24MP]|uniref:TVP38/TMEM64 family protein n=1 Tax=Proteiniclasticum sp. C24MP TaxID=3374101 RepID=UPI00375511F7